jgi:hypothetical protein
MIHLFNQGQRKEFFRRWVENIVVNDSIENIDDQKLEFELNIHFAIYYYRKNKDVYYFIVFLSYYLMSKNFFKKKMKTQAKEAMMAFKTYIENKGNVLSQINQYLPYFSLPYCENPQNNFPEIFTV